MDVGGAELRTIELAQKFPEVDFTFVTVSRLPGKLDEAVTSSGHRLAKMGLSPLGMLRFARLIWKQRFHVVHSNLGLASGPFLSIAALMRVPVRVAHFRSEGIGGTSSAKRRLGIWVSRRLIDRYATLIAGVSPGSLRSGWSERWEEDDRCEILVNHIDVASLEGPDMPEVVGVSIKDEGTMVRVCNIGRKEPSKRQELAVRVWAAFQEQVPATLFLIGSLSEPARVAVGSLPLSLQQAVTVREYVPQAGRLLRDMSVTLATSSREGLPGVVLESLALGTPVVGSDIPANRWIASQVAGVHLVRMDAPLSDWVTALQRASDVNRQEIRDAFARSIFASVQVLSSYVTAWNEGRDYAVAR